MTVLSSDDSLAEDVEGDREDRRSRQGYVEPRAARSFLALARALPHSEGDERDPVTRAYFRNLERPTALVHAAVDAGRFLDAIRALDPSNASKPPGLPDRATRATKGRAGTSGAQSVTIATTASNPERPANMPLVDAMRVLSEIDSEAFAGRIEEFAYLTNVLMAGASRDDERFRLANAADAVLATVSLGAELRLRDRRNATHRPRPTDLSEVLRTCNADVLFRLASRTLMARKVSTTEEGVLLSRDELERVRARLFREKTKKVRKS